MVSREDRWGLEVKPLPVESRYRSIRDRLVDGAIRAYDDPRDEVHGIAGLLAVYDKEVDIEAGPARF